MTFRRKCAGWLQDMVFRLDPLGNSEGVAIKAKESVRVYLAGLNKTQVPLDYAAIVQRSQQARNFVDHPYWAVLSRMLNGTIQAEMEEMLSGDDKLALNRASVGICRKILRAPFFDIEQGKEAEAAYSLACQRLGNQRNTQEKEHTPWLREVGR